MVSRYAGGFLAIAAICTVGLRSAAPAYADLPLGGETVVVEKSVTSYRSGTGFVVDPSGVVVTCYHVVHDAARVEVVLGEREVSAFIQRTDPKHDLAILRLRGAGSLPSIPLAPRGAEVLGEEVRAFGFPLADALGTGLKVTRGTISGIDADGDERVLQVDVPVNPGNSGGPLVDAHGRVLGVITSRYEEAHNFGAAVPVSMPSPLLERHREEAEMGAALEGPELVKRIAPALAYLRVHTNPPPSPLVSASANIDLQPKEITPQPEGASPKATGIAVPAPSKSDGVTKPAADPTTPPAPTTGCAQPTATAPPTVTGTETTANPPVKTEAAAKAGTAAAPATSMSPTVTCAGMVQPPAPVPYPKSTSGPTSKSGTAGGEAASIPEMASPANDKSIAPGKSPVASTATATTSATSAPSATAPTTVTSDPASGSPKVTPGSAAAPGPGAAPKPAPTDIDRELEGIRADAPLELPQPQLDPSANPDKKAKLVEWQIVNLTASPLQVVLRGPEKRSFTVPPGKTSILQMAAGEYEVGARLVGADIAPLYSRQQFEAGERYRSRFHVDPQ